MTIQKNTTQISSMNLFDGEFNEAQNAAAFQDALASWRTAKPTTTEQTSSIQITSTTIQKNVTFEPHTKSMETQSTMNKSEEIMNDINVNMSRLSLTQRLLLQKYRKMYSHEQNEQEV